MICILLYLWSASVGWCIESCVQNFDISWSTISTSLFQPLVIASKELVWGHVEGDFTSPTTLLQRSSLAAQSKLCIWLCEVQCLHAYVTTLIQSRVYTLTKINFHVFWSSWGYCIYFYCENFVSSCNQTGVLYWKLFPMFVIATFIMAVGGALPPTVCCTYHRTSLRTVNAFISSSDTDEDWPMQQL